jgi:hypothetical protein
MPERADIILPRWARVLDAVGVALVLIGLSVILTGGFREWTPLGRVSVTSWVRPLIIGVIALLVRHFIWRSPSIVSLTFATLKRWKTSDDARVIWPIFLSTRVGVLAVGFLAIVLIGYPPESPPWRIYKNELLNIPARWDAGWYLSVAVEGYDWFPPWATRQQNIAFFPLFPMLMRYGSLFVARQMLWVGVLISFGSFFLALRYLYRLARPVVGDESAAAGLALLATYPFAFFYSAPYTEALFLLVAVAACYHFERDELWQAGLFGLAAGLCRPNGCLLSVVLALMAVRPLWKREAWEWKTVATRMAVAAMPGIGMLMFSAYIYSLTGNPLQWAAQNAAWGRVYRPVDVLVGEHVDFLQQRGLYDYASTRALDMLHSIAVLFVLGSIWPVYRRFGLPYAALIAINVLPPLAMGGLLSMGRVTSVIFPTFLWLGAAIPARQRTGWLVVFAMLQALCAIVFFTWRPLY